MTATDLHAEPLTEGQTLSLAKTIEWPTVSAIGMCYAGWGALTWITPHLPIWLAIPAVLALIILTTFHSSLMHEVCHGHPTRKCWLNEASVFIQIGLLVPFRRFRTLHLRHHCDEALTDPYDDPESCYLADRDWYALSPFMKRVMSVNNTLLGRMVIGPALYIVGFLRSEFGLIVRNAPRIRKAWALHLVGVVIVASWLVLICGWSLPVYAALIAYPALSLLMVRTFAEHQAHDSDGGRTAIVTHGGPWSLLFLNNNLHFVHHSHPRTAWYHLPALYRSQRDAFHARNEGYVFQSYRDVFRQYLFRRKEPVAHPILRK